MDKVLQIQLLGNFHLVYDGVPVLGVDSPRLQSFLAYLLINRDSPLQRQHLAYLFWPDSTESQARTNLRNLLHRLREVLPEADGFLDVGTKTLWWQPESSYSVDLDDFEAAAAQAEGAQKTGDQESLRKSLEEAVEAYGGDLLPSCYDDWIFPERERLSQVYISSLEELVKIQEKSLEYAAAIKNTQLLLRYDPLHEESYRRLMNLYTNNGDKARAVRTYHTCAAVLEKELEMDPSPATSKLYQQLLDREIEPQKPSRVSEKGAGLIGRDEVWKTLLKTWQDLEGEAHLLLIKGEAGIGKTHLAEEFLRWTRRGGINTITTRSYPGEGELAYTPVSEILKNENIRKKLTDLEDIWLIELSRLLPGILTDFPALSHPEQLGESWERQRMFEACARAVLQGKERLVILMDDLQWCDRETLSWLRYMLDFEINSKLIFVGTLRTEELAPDSPMITLISDLKQSGKITEIELYPLDLKGTYTLASTLWGEKLDDRAAESLFQETEGNPLFVVEVVRSGFLSPEKIKTEEFSLPPKVQAVIESRLGALKDQTRELCNLASVVGREFDFELLNQAGELDQDTVLDGLDELWQRRLIRDEGEEGYNFSHDKFREVIYQNLSPHRRTHLHQKVASALEDLHPDQLENISSQLAHHFDLGGKPDQAVDYFIQAGDQARLLYARENAIVYYQRAADLLGKVKDSRFISLFQGWGNAHLKLAQYDKAAEAYQQMRSGAIAVGDKAAEARAWLALGKVRDRQGDFKDALICADKAIKAAQSNNLEGETADAFLLKGQQHYRLGEADLAEPLLKKGLDLHKKGQDQVAVGRCLNLLGLIEDVWGNFSSARGYKEDAIKLFEEIEDRQSQWWIGNITLNLAITADLQGDYQDAVDLYQNAMETMEEISDQDWKRTCLLNLSGSRVGLREYQQAERDLQQVLELTGSSEWLGLSLAYYFLAESYLGLQRGDEAYSAAIKALEIAEKSGAREFLGAAWRVLGKVASQMANEITVIEKTYQAPTCFKKSVKIFGKAGVDRERAHTLKAWAEHELDSGEKKKGDKMWNEAKEIFQRLDMAAEVKRMEKES